MKRYLLGLAVLMAFAVLLLRAGNEPTPAFIFVSWMKQSDRVTIRLRGGHNIQYEGKKLRAVIEELESWEKTSE